MLVAKAVSPPMDKQVGANISTLLELTREPATTSNAKDADAAEILGLSPERDEGHENTRTTTADVTHGITTKQVGALVLLIAQVMFIAVAKALVLLIAQVMFIALVHARSRVVRCDSASKHPYAFTIIALGLMTCLGNVEAAMDAKAASPPTTAADQALTAVVPTRHTQVRVCARRCCSLWNAPLACRLAAVSSELLTRVSVGVCSQTFSPDGGSKRAGATAVPPVGAINKPIDATAFDGSSLPTQVMRRLSSTPTPYEAAGWQRDPSSGRLVYPPSLGVAPRVFGTPSDCSGGSCVGVASVHVPRWTRSAPWHQGTKTAVFLPPDCSANVAGCVRLPRATATTSAPFGLSVVNPTVSFTAAAAYNGPTGESAYTYTSSWADADGDGDLDLFVGKSGANELWLNDGSGGFTAATGGPTEGTSSTASWADVDGDGEEHHRHDADQYGPLRGQRRLFVSRIWQRAVAQRRQRWLYGGDGRADGRERDGRDLFVGNHDTHGGGGANELWLYSRCATGPWLPSGGCAACSSVFARSEGERCVECAAHSERGAAGDCELCAAGTERPLGSSACLSCPAGEYGVQGSACSACARGKYAGASGTATCTACPGFSTTNAVGATSADACTCVQGYNADLDDNGNLVCLGCPAFSTMSSDSDVCECNQGYYSSLDATNNLVCVACPAFSSSSAIGATSVDACECNQGYYSGLDATGSSVCLACPAFSTITSDAGSTGSGACTCNQGYFLDTDATGKPVCEQCRNVFDFSTTPSAGATSVDECVCNPGYYLKAAAGNSTRTTVRECVLCDADLLDCSTPGVTVANMPIATGAWRVSNTSTQVLECFNKAACVGAAGPAAAAANATAASRRQLIGGTNAASLAVSGSTAGDALCAAGHTGILCGACLDGHYGYKDDALCTECEGNIALGFAPLIIAVVLIALAALVRFIAKKRGRSLGSKATTVWAKARSKSKKAAIVLERARPKLKILVSLYQIIGGLGATFAIPFPNIYEQIVSVVSGILTIELPSLMPIGCLAPSNFHSLLVFKTAWPLVAYALLYLLAKLLRKAHKDKYADGCIDLLFLIMVCAHALRRPMHPQALSSAQSSSWRWPLPSCLTPSCLSPNALLSLYATTHAPLHHTVHRVPVHLQRRLLHILLRRARGRHVVAARRPLDPVHRHEPRHDDDPRDHASLHGHHDRRARDRHAGDLHLPPLLEAHGGPGGAGRAGEE